MKKPELDRRKLATETLKSTAGSPGWERGIEVVCHSDDGALVTVFSSFLGVARRPEDASYTAHLEEILPEAELALRLPDVLVAEGMAKGPGSDFCTAALAFCASRHCHTLGEALREMRDVLSFTLEATCHKAEEDVHLRELVADAACLEEFVHSQSGALTSDSLPNLIDELKKQGRKGCMSESMIRGPQ
ncbi:unnamed protein product [Symbiodinium sp. KB8]|nr:unnamed protein product [Symbiodinium sp. KB8]